MIYKNMKARIDIQNRDFVLIPMAQLAPFLRHPVLNITIKQMLEKLGDR